MQETENEKSSLKSETHDYKNTDSEIDDKELYELDKLSLDDNYIE